MSVLAPTDILGIEATTKDILLSVYASLEDVEVPVNLNLILKNSGLDVKEGQFKEPEIAGAYDKANKTIYVAQKEPYTRKSFTIAHELGHFFLHSNVPSEVFYRNQITNLTQEDKKIEAQANWFAASLLMPEHLVKKYWELTNHNIDELATIFNVSPTALYYRLKNLELTQ
jgi:Zn-dependent peptidase ImmA (M78 family)